VKEVDAMDLHTPLLIAVDGPAASGKGTLAKRIADYFSLEYLDTGTLYRAVGYKLLSHGADPKNEEKAVEAAKSITIKDICSTKLYQEGVGMAASIVAAIPAVREALAGFQQKVAKNPKGAVLDGRDIGTVICPNANFKFYITADIEARAQRRYKQLQNKENSIIYQEVLEDLQRRDERDSKRSVAPLVQAKDAIHIDTTHMSAEEVFGKVLSVIKQEQLLSKVGP
jgi:cytidylate kinase